jgi:hypothetical protein
MTVFENGLLRRIFGSRRDKVTREWRKIHIEELNVLNVLLTKYCLGDEIGKNGVGGEFCAHGEEERPIQSFGGET